MLNESLYLKLIDKNIITNGTEVLASVKSKGIDGNMSANIPKIVYITNIILKENQLPYLYGYTNEDGSKHFVFCEQIIEIDGMDPQRLAKTFNLRVDGTKAKTGKKRGRKSKKEKELMNG